MCLVWDWMRTGRLWLMPEINRGPEPRIADVMEEVRTNLEQRAPHLDWTVQPYWTGRSDLPDCLLICATTKDDAFHARTLLSIESYERSVISVEDHILPVLEEKIKFAEFLTREED